MNNMARNPDHADMAKMVEDHIGPENILRGPSGVWLFDGLIWRQADDQSLKRVILEVLGANLNKVMANSVTSTLSVLKAQCYDPDLKFDLGDPNIVVLKDGYYTYGDGHWTKVPANSALHRRTQIPHTYTDERPVLFDAFLRSIFTDACGRPVADTDPLIKLVWEMLGYCIAIHARWEKCFFLIGPGANGKSVLGNIARRLVGVKNVAAVQPNQMGNVFQRSHLEGKLLNLVTELNQNEEVDDGILKALVSGEMMTVERKHADPREIVPFATHIFLTNHMPRLRDYTDGIYRRVTVLPLMRQFLGSDADPDLTHKLESEMDAIASRAMDALGTLIDKKGQFTDCNTVEAAKAEWRRENDQVKQFVEECLYRKAGQDTSLENIYMAYQTWLLASGGRGALKKDTLSKRLAALGVERRRHAQGIVFIGVAIR